MKYAHVINYFESHPWAILPEKFSAILSLIEMKANGLTLTQSEIDSRIGAVMPRPEPRDSVSGNVAVIPIHGTIAHRAGLMSRMSGGASIEDFRRSFRSALANTDVTAIVLDIDSPGGSTSGLDEMATEIFEARDRIKITAVANTLAASAAYYLGSQAHEFFATPSALVGSIGTIAVHFDESKRLEAEGVKATIVSSGKFKAEGHPAAPLSDAALEHLQDLVEARYGEFVAAVARGRNVPERDVRNGFGEGRVLVAKAAKAAGMIDGVRTLEQVVAKQPKRRPAVRATTAAAVEPPELDADVDVDEGLETPELEPAASGGETVDAGLAQAPAPASTPSSSSASRRRELELLELDNGPEPPDIPAWFPG